MSKLALNAITALALLHTTAYHTAQVGNLMRFRFRRSSMDALPGVQELMSLGIPFRFYTGGHIYTYDAAGNCTHRAANVVRPHATVEVQVA